MINTNHYTITRENLPIHEIMGLQVQVVRSTDPKKKGIKGIIVDETQRTLVIETRNEEKILPKNESTFAFDLNGELVELDGEELMGNPIERLKNGGKH